MASILTSSIASAVAVSSFSPAFSSMLQSPKVPKLSFCSPASPAAAAVARLARPRTTPLLALVAFSADIDLSISRLSRRRLGRPFCLLLFFCRSRIRDEDWSFHRCLKLVHAEFFACRRKSCPALIYIPASPTVVAFFLKSGCHLTSLRRMILRVIRFTTLYVSLGRFQAHPSRTYLTPRASS